MDAIGGLDDMMSEMVCRVDGESVAK